MKVVLSASFSKELLAIGDYIAQESSTRAENFVNELLDKARGLNEMPRRFPLVPRYEYTGIRRVTYRGYLIFYQVEADRVVVLHVVNGAQDYAALVFPSE